MSDAAEAKVFDLVEKVADLMHRVGAVEALATGVNQSAAQEINALKGEIAALKAKMPESPKEGG